jgi:transposase
LSAQLVVRLNLRGPRAVGLDRASGKHGTNYAIIFIDMDRMNEPVLFVVPSNGTACAGAFRGLLLSHGG